MLAGDTLRGGIGGGDTAERLATSSLVLCLNASCERVRLEET